MMATSDILSPSPQQLVLIGCIAVALTLAWVLARRRRPMDEAPKQYRRKIDDAVARGQTLTQDLESLLAELERLSRRMHEQLDTRVVDLGRVIAEADQRIATLRDLIAQAQAATPAPRMAEVEDHGPDSYRETVSAAVNEMATIMPAPVGRMSASTLSAGEVSVAPQPDRRRRIVELADRGLTPGQIAQELGQPVGEVELVLNLRKAATSSG